MKTLEEFNSAIAEIAPHATTYVEVKLVELCRSLAAHVYSRPPIVSPVAVEAWDWSQPNRVLAQRHSVPSSQVAMTRKLLGKPKVYKWADIDTTGWDWAQANSTIARQFRVSVGVVNRLRKDGDHPPPTQIDKISPYKGRCNSQVPMTSYKDLDWTKTDTELAKQVGCSRENIRIRRASLGMPRALSYEKNYALFVKRAAGRTELTNFDTEKMGFVWHYANRYAARAGIKLIAFAKPTKRCYRPWDEMNWSLPNKILNELWQLPKNSAAIRRAKASMPKAAFRTRSLIRNRGEVRVPMAFTAEVEEERVKAAAWLEKRAKT